MKAIDECVVVVHGADDSGRERDLVSLEFLGVAGPVQPFMMAADDVQHFLGKPRESSEHLHAKIGMQLIFHILDF